MVGMMWFNFKNTDNFFQLYVKYNPNVNVIRIVIFILFDPIKYQLSV